jgi:hypothetical protein
VSFAGTSNIGNSLQPFTHVAARGILAEKLEKRKSFLARGLPDVDTIDGA